MTFIENSYWTLRVDPTRPIPLTPEEPEDFMYEVCGKILCGTMRFESKQAMQRKRDFSSPLVNVYANKNDYAL